VSWTKNHRGERGKGEGNYGTDRGPYVSLKKKPIRGGRDSERGEGVNRVKFGKEFVELLANVCQSMERLIMLEAAAVMAYQGKKMEKKPHPEKYIRGGGKYSNFTYRISPHFGGLKKWTASVAPGH